MLMAMSRWQFHHEHVSDCGAARSTTSMAWSFQCNSETSTGAMRLAALAKMLRREDGIHKAWSRVGRAATWYEENTVNTGWSHYKQ